MPHVSRRGFMVTASAAAVSATRGIAAPPRELLELPAVDAIAKIAQGDITAERYASTLLDQCERLKALNAFITLDRERVLAAARAADQRRKSGKKLGPLGGLPIPVKDSVNTKDYPTTGGTPALRHFQPKEDAAIVRKLKDAGAIVMGKTNLHELSWGWTSNNLAYGAVHNPYDPLRIPGGSSGGTAAAIASRMAPLGVAEDTEGSIRVPAAMCGIAGLRPTTTRYPTTNVVPISTLFDQVGPHARTVADLALFDSVVTGDFSPIRPTPLKGLKLGVGRAYWFSGLDPEVERVTSDALRKLQDAGVELVEAEVTDVARIVGLITDQIQNHDTRYTLKKYLTDYQTGVTFDQLVAMASKDIRDDFAINVLPGGTGFITDAYYETARNVHLPALRKNYRDYFARTGVAAIVFPAIMIPPPRIGEDGTVSIGAKQVPFAYAVARNIAPGSTAGIPGLVLPAGLTKSGLPLALEFDGPSGGDRALLALGASVERVLGHLPAPKL